MTTQKAPMPANPAAMRQHMMAEPPAGHGASDMGDMPMAEMVSRHDAMHADGADHEHAGMASASAPARKAFKPHDLKLSETGDVTLAFSRFNVIDSDNDVTFPGAMPVGKSVPMSAFGHTSWDGALPTGKGTIRESGDLGILDGGFFMETDQGRNTYHTVKAMGDLQEWSYGYRVLPPSGPEVFNGQAVRALRKLDVDEVSPVLKGAGVGTTTLAIKSGAPASGAPYAEQILWYSEGLPALLDRFKGHAAARASEGRKLSRSDRAALEELVETLDGQIATARELLIIPDPDGPAKQAAVRQAEIENALALARHLGVLLN